MFLNGSDEGYLNEIKGLQDLFGSDFYLKLERFYMDDQDIQQDRFNQESWLLQKYQDYHEKQEILNEKLVGAAKQFNIKYVACNEICYLDRDDWRAHEVLMNIQSGEPCEIWEKDSMGNLKSKVLNPKRRTLSSHEFYFKSFEQMQVVFKDHPEAFSASIDISEKCDLQLDFQTKHYPVFIPPSLHDESKYTEKERIKATEEFLLELCNKGI